MNEAGRPLLPAHLRPYDDTPVHTADLPALPIRDRNIPAEAWIEAPVELLESGDDIGFYGGPGRPKRQTPAMWPSTPTILLESAPSVSSLTAPAKASAPLAPPINASAAGRKR